MDYNSMGQLISTLGFPIICAVVCFWFIYKMWDKETTRNQLITDTLVEVNETNKELSTTNKMLVDEFSKKIVNIASDVEIIKDNLLK